MLQHYYSIDKWSNEQTMRNYNRRLFLSKEKKVLQQRLLCFCIQRGSRFIKKDDTGISNKSAGKRNFLPTSSGCFFDVFARTLPALTLVVAGFSEQHLPRFNSLSYTPPPDGAGVLLNL